MSDLKPCPFCGSPAENKGDFGMFYISCTNYLNCVAPTARSVEEWNTRHIDPATKAQIEADVLRRVADEWEGWIKDKHYARLLRKESDRILKEAGL